MKAKIVKLLHDTKLKSRLSFLTIISFLPDLDTSFIFMKVIHPYGA